MKRFLMTLAAAFCCVMIIAVLTACSENDDNPSSEGNSGIVGTWYSNVSGKTFSKWNYGETWQTTEFKSDLTGSTHIYYTLEDNAIGCEKVDFTYMASADGALTMTRHQTGVSLPDVCKYRRYEYGKL